MKVAACVLTYNRKELLLKCLSAIRRQSRPVDSIIVVDNGSSDATADALRQDGWFVEGSFQYIRLEQNIGSAGGFFTCVKSALEQGCDWLWLMDDDVTPSPTALDRLLRRAADVAHGKIGGLISYNQSPNTQARFRLPRTALEALRYAVSCPIDDDRSGQVIPVDWCHLASFLMPMAIARQIGLPRKEFFLYCEDIDFTLRIRNAGYSLLLVGDSLIDHPVGVAAVKKVGETVSLRWYYNYRNHIANVLIHSKDLGPVITVAILIRISLGALRRILLTVLRRDYRGTRLLVLAVLDGYGMRLGKYGAVSKVPRGGFSVDIPEELSDVLAIPAVVSVAGAVDGSAPIKTSSETAI